MVKKARDAISHFFVDEAGDATFYDRRGNCIVGQPGCSPLLLLGFIETTDPQPLRQAVLRLQQEIVSDRYFGSFPSISRTAIAFHAKDDLPEIRYLFFKLIAGLNFRAQFVVARKVERAFRNNFHARQNEFYDYLVSRLFENVLHRHTENRIIFAQRGSRERQLPLQKAILAGVRRFETKWQAQVTSAIRVQAQQPKGEPCLSIVDYMNWAVYRAFTRGEMRYYDVVSDKVSLLVDLYDRVRYPNNWYSKRNPFDVKKITPL